MTVNYGFVGAREYAHEEYAESVAPPFRLMCIMARAAFHYDRGQRNALEAAAKAVCFRCAHGWPVEPRNEPGDGRAVIHRAQGGFEACKAWAIHDLLNGLNPAPAGTVAKEANNR